MKGRFSVVALLHLCSVRSYGVQRKRGGWAMGLREFRDSKGVQWKVWNVTPDALDKRTAAEDYMRDWQDGWLCFECPEHRRRLASFPPGWEDLPDAELERLLARSQPVRRRGLVESAADTTRPGDEAAKAAPAADVERPRAPNRPDAGRMTPSTGIDTTRTRTLTDSRGRTFFVGLFRVPHTESADGRLSTSPGTVLRFMSGSVVLDLAEWPDDWYRYTDSQLMGLLDRAQPADHDAVGDSLPLRRQTDIPG
jgi:hypothetical protein